MFPTEGLSFLVLKEQIDSSSKVGHLQAGLLQPVIEKIVRHRCIDLEVSYEFRPVDQRSLPPNDLNELLGGKPETTSKAAETVGSVVAEVLQAVEEVSNAGAVIFARVALGDVHHDAFGGLGEVQDDGFVTADFIWTFVRDVHRLHDVEVAIGPAVKVAEATSNAFFKFFHDLFGNGFGL